MTLIFAHIFIPVGNEPSGLLKANLWLAWTFGDCRKGLIPRSLLQGISLLL